MKKEIEEKRVKPFLFFLFGNIFVFSERNSTVHDFEFVDGKFFERIILRILDTYTKEFYFRLGVEGGRGRKTHLTFRGLWHVEICRKLELLFFPPP